jgi:hypothetical protein
MKSAQITVYLTLSFTLILSMFFTVFEAARGNYMKLKIENAVKRQSIHLLQNIIRNCLNDTAYCL